MALNDFRDDDEAAHYWLAILRRGRPEHKLLARTEIGLLLEKRGLLDEAAEAFWTNVEANVPDRRPYERLTAIYREQGDRLSETLIQKRFEAAFPPDAAGSDGVAAVIDTAHRPGRTAASSQDADARRRRRTARRPLTRADLAFTAAVGVVALGVLALVLSVFGVGRPPLMTTLRLPVRCYDGAVRFPGADNPEAAVRQAYIDGGAALSPSSERFIGASAAQIVGGWIGASLLLDRNGLPAPTLAAWVSAEPSERNLTGLLLEGRTLDSLILDSEWNEIQSWPADSCEGAFVKNPRNAPLVRLVEAVVGSD